MVPVYPAAIVPATANTKSTFSRDVRFFARASAAKKSIS
jgi:hypothetical protein